MTAAEPGVGRSRRLVVAVAAALVVIAIGWLAFSGIGSALVYYRTPTELTALGAEAIGTSVRLGGLVKAGTLSCQAGVVEFVLTDGDTELTVRSASESRALLCPREDRGVVVQGRLGTIGVFEATEVIIKHDENYVAPSEGALPTQVFDPGT